MTNSLINNALVGKINAALGTISLYSNKSCNDPLCTTILDESENHFESVVSSLEDN